MPRLIAIAAVLAACLATMHAVAASPPLGPSAARARPAIATLAIPGDPRLVAIARDILQVQTEQTPDFASQSGLIDDAIRVPSFTPEHVAAMTSRVHADMSRLRALPWRRWSVDRQIDVRWLYANAARIDRELNVERLYLHRPGAWLETLANNYIAILTYAPSRTDALDAITARVPALVTEMAAMCKPTKADAQTSLGLLDGIVSMLKANNIAGAEAAIAALTSYRPGLEAVRDAADAEPYAVVGAENYAWRLRHASLLPWEPAALLALAQRRITEVNAELATLTPQLPAVAPLPPELENAAVDLDQARLLALYDQIQIKNRAAIERAGFVTIPSGVGPVRARVTPDAMVPLTGDGGSMNAPPPFIDDNTGWWNVEHFNPQKTRAEREAIVRQAALPDLNSMGPYAVHEGVPGHHLQLSIARLNPNPLRSLFQDAVQNEGWALYAEQLMWEQGGLGDSLQAHVNTLRSWRFRMRRVVYDVNIETAVWTLQQAADWKSQSEPGQGVIDPDLKRAVNWPAQLICYFAGKEQILQLKADYRKKMGRRYSERRFHDELLALGSVPYVFARAKMLGEALPGF
ncbi:MAG TPA: DUF885 family protein [Burkholderiaceae bacterium]|nr:DUF885 family protein [Burkholderiaceae bacterium]